MGSLEPTEKSTPLLATIPDQITMNAGKAGDESRGVAGLEPWKRLPSTIRATIAYVIRHARRR
jgi:hypothetical protein